MAACYESISYEKCESMLGLAIGMKISKTWQGIGTTLFLELGKLLRIRTPLGTWREGQATVMIASVWRIEGPRSIHLGSTFGEKQLARELPKLVGKTVQAVGIDGSTRELVLGFSDGRTLRTFTEYTSQPQWTFSVRDLALLDLDSVWDGTDVSPSLHMHAGRPRIEYCFDEAEADLDALKRRYRLHFHRRRS